MRSLKYFSVLAILLMVWGCSNVLDTQPKQSISEGLALNSSDNVKSVLIGAYDNLGNYYVYGGQYYMLPDLMAVGQEAQWTGTYTQPGDIYRKNIQVDNSFVRDGWLNGYNTINVANNVLSALDIVNEADRDRVEGEAKFIRAITYFQLVRLFAKDYNDGDPTQNLGVPLKLEPTRTIGDNANIPRNTVQQVYEQIISDLQDARDLLDSLGKNGTYANTYAASAFLARVYLQQGDYPAARDAANRVINEGPYSLVDNYSEAFNNSNVNTSEDIFAMQVTNQDGTNSLQIFYAAQDPYGGRGDIGIQQSHLDLYESGDDRLAFFYDDGGVIRTGKWSNQYGNVNVIRLAEMYLIRAEGNQRLSETSNGVTPTDDINTIRERAGLDPLTGPVGLQEILDERHIELAFEGHFLFDLKRTQGSVGGVSWDSPRMVYPIPQREMDANPELEQNEGYLN